MVDIVEIYVHWYAGRSKNQLAPSLGVDRKTIRKYLAPAEASGMAPGWAAHERGGLGQADQELVPGTGPALAEPGHVGGDRAAPRPGQGAAGNDHGDAKPKDKPRVERPMPYVRDSFSSGWEFSSVEQIHAEALAWSARTAGRRQCRPLGGASPLSMFEAMEAKTLLPLPDKPFVLARWSAAAVGPDIHIKVGCTLYSVPWKLIGRKVDVRSTATMVQVFHEGELVKTHAALDQDKRTDRNDYPPEKIAFQMKAPIWCRSQSSEVGDACREVIDQLLEVNALYRLRAAQGMLGLRKKYGDQRLEAACTKAIAVGDASYRTIKGILIAGTGTDPEPETGDAGAAAFLHAPRACSPRASPPRPPVSPRAPRATLTPTTPRRPLDERDGHRPARVAAGASAVRDAGDPGRAADPGPRW
ncbi:hypothetical protein [Streptomyces sp. NPDC056549]|uniref:Mu transposase domain-containing protein n=1 Tax=Streptomyces sp. NPDC056549 TaxID=3345864 RepID=UPI0036B654FE